MAKSFTPRGAVKSSSIKFFGNAYGTSTIIKAHDKKYDVMWSISGNYGARAGLSRAEALDYHNAAVRDLKFLGGEK
jgi:hypothetical protein